MGLFSGMAKAGLAKKAMDEARKPANQEKIKGLVGKVTNRGGKGGAPGAGGRP